MKELREIDLGWCHQTASQFDDKFLINVTNEYYESKINIEVEG